MIETPFKKITTHNLQLSSEQYRPFQRRASDLTHIKSAQREVTNLSIPQPIDNIL